MKSITNENNLGSSGGGGIELVDINSNKASDLPFALCLKDSYYGMNVDGYKKLSILLRATNMNSVSYYFMKKDGTSTSVTTTTLPNFSTNQWTDIDITDDYYLFAIKWNSSTTSQPIISMYYSLLPDKKVVPSPYNIELVDINPDNLTSGDNCYAFEFVKSSSWYKGNRMVVCGYKRMKIYTNPSYYSNCKYKFQLSDGTFTAVFNATSGWSDYIDIPNNAIGLWGLNTGSETLINYYSLYTDKQVIPTKVTEDINPNKDAAGSGTPGSIYLTLDGYIPSIPICGYKKFSASFTKMNGNAGNVSWRFAYSDGTFGEWNTITTSLSPSYSSWFDYVDIPSNVVCVQLKQSTSVSSVYIMRYSLLA